jgi:hypothetical protein
MRKTVCMLSDLGGGGGFRTRPRSRSPFPHKTFAQRGFAQYVAITVMRGILYGYRSNAVYLSFQKLICDQ